MNEARDDDLSRSGMDKRFLKNKNIELLRPLPKPPSLAKAPEAAQVPGRDLHSYRS